MRYLSVCSGIEAATVAWHPLGWTPVAFSEIEPFPSAVLAHHYPTVPNWGDMTKYQEWPDEPIDLLVGGTPCQSFSVAGLRKGLDDPRGNLMLTYLAIAAKYRPKWVVWENVPGVLSSNGGRDFAALLRGLAELGYGWAYRVLDAQFARTSRFPRAVPQRRRRVFVVGHLGDWHRAAAVLFESESVQRNPPPSRETRQGVARGVGGGPEGGSISGAVTRKWAKGSGGPAGDECYNMVAQPVAFSDIGQGQRIRPTDMPSETLRATKRGPYSDYYQVAQPVAIAWDEELNASVEQAGTLLRGGAGGRHDGVMVPQPIAIHPHVVGRSPNAGPQGKEYIDDGSAYCMDARGVPQSVVQPVAFKVRGGVEVDSAGKAAGKGFLGSEETAFTLAATQDQWIGQPVATFAKTHKPMSATDAEGWSPIDAAPTVTHWPRDRSDAGTDVAVVQPAMQVRRLTPVECSRLQGFPDNYTNIPWRGKPESPDGPRYKALGNSMAVNCMDWIGRRIAMVDAIGDK